VGDGSVCLCFAGGISRSFIFPLCLPVLCSVPGSLCPNSLPRSVGTLTLPR